MYVKKIKYIDYDGNEREEEHCFHLNEAELIKWVTVNKDYTLDNVIDQLAKEKDGKEIMRIFDELIYLSYGKKTLDGRRFIKTDEVKREFMETEAYSSLFMELVTDAKKAAEFISAIIPKNINSTIEKIVQENPDGIPDEMKDYLLGVKQ